MGLKIQNGIIPLCIGIKIVIYNLYSIIYCIIYSYIYL